MAVHFDDTSASLRSWPSDIKERLIALAKADNKGQDYAEFDAASNTTYRISRLRSVYYYSRIDGGGSSFWNKSKNGVTPNPSVPATSAPYNPKPEGNFINGTELTNRGYYGTSKEANKLKGKNSLGQDAQKRLKAGLSWWDSNTNTLYRLSDSSDVWQQTNVDANGDKWKPKPAATDTAPSVTPGTPATPTKPKKDKPGKPGKNKKNPELAAAAAAAKNVLGANAQQEALANQAIRVFNNVDRNKDGVISKKEAKKELKDHGGGDGSASDNRQNALAHSVLNGGVNTRPAAFVPAAAPAAPAPANDVYAESNLASANVGNAAGQQGYDYRGVGNNSTNGYINQNEIRKEYDREIRQQYRYGGDRNLGDRGTPQIKTESFKIADADGSGKLTGQEIRIFHQVDADNDGSITTLEANNELSSKYNGQNRGYSEYGHNKGDNKSGSNIVDNAARDTLANRAIAGAVPAASTPVASTPVASASPVPGAPVAGDLIDSNPSNGSLKGTVDAAHVATDVTIITPSNSVPINDVADAVPDAGIQEAEPADTTSALVDADLDEVDEGLDEADTDLAATAGGIAGQKQKGTANKQKGVNRAKGNSGQSKNNGAAPATASVIADVNRNGAISKKERKAFNAVDTNDNGKISKKEATKLRDQIAGHPQSAAEKSQDALAKQYLATAKGKGGNIKANADPSPAQTASPKKQKKNK